MIRTIEELKAQAEKENIHWWPYHACSLCGYVCGYIIQNGLVYYDSGCDCMNDAYTVTPRTWEGLQWSYNMNQPENNPRVSQEYLHKVNEVWKF